MHNDAGDVGAKLNPAAVGSYEAPKPHKEILWLTDHIRPMGGLSLACGNGRLQGSISGAGEAAAEDGTTKKATW